MEFPLVFSRWRPNRIGHSVTQGKLKTPSRNKPLGQVRPRDGRDHRLGGDARGERGTSGRQVGCTLVVWNFGGSKMQRTVPSFKGPTTWLQYQTNMELASSVSSKEGPFMHSPGAVHPAFGRHGSNGRWLPSAKTAEADLPSTS